MQVLNFVTENRRTNWDTFTVQDDWAVNFLVALGELTISDEMLQLMLAEKDYRMFRYKKQDGKYAIGYGVGDPDDAAGMTEAEAYTAWLKDIKDRERVYKRSLPFLSMTQTQYDVLFSLFYHTGTWKRVDSDVGIYDIYTAVKSERWLLATDMIADGKIEASTRRLEARVLRLGDYSTGRTRTFLRGEGIKFALSQYSSNGITNEFDKRQIETAYFRQTTAFIPGISELRKRELINKLGHQH